MASSRHTQTRACRTDREVLRSLLLAKHMPTVQYTDAIIRNLPCSMVWSIDEHNGSTSHEWLQNVRADYQPDELII